MDCIGYDAAWQYPAITEEHAYRRALTTFRHPSDSVYFGFPWATFIDLLNTKGVRAASPFRDVLDRYKSVLQGYSNVVTVCQHIRMLEHIKHFESVGVNHIFWSHTTKAMQDVQVWTNMKIYPFPLYPVQIPPASSVQASNNRRYLYSFVGARSNQWYLTQSRNIIIELFQRDPRGRIVCRDHWHYNRIVYDHQIHKRASQGQELINQSNSDEFREILLNSVFSLCPSGTGPNSIRLWESIGFGAIPVILADTYQAPGDFRLWEDAAIFCEETRDAIQRLPAVLEEIARDAALLERKRHALKQLWMLYGPDGFIYDVQRLCLELAGCAGTGEVMSMSLALERLLEIAKVIERDGRGAMEALGAFLLGCGVRVMCSPDKFRECLQSNPSLKNAFRIAMRYGDVKHTNIITAVLKEKHIELDPGHERARDPGLSAGAL